MKLARRRVLHLAASALALPALPTAASAEDFPSRRITVIVPFAAGALNDLVARIMAQAIQPSLGQPVVIENVTGADGTIGATRAVRAEPDGYTLFVGSWNTQVANPLIYKLQYDAAQDFVPVAMLPSSAMVLLGKKELPANNLGEFIAWLKANPDKAAFGTAGPGSPPDMLARLFGKDSDTRFSLVAYRGAAPAMQDVIGGQIDANFITAAAALPQVAAGSVKAFGITSHQRLVQAPNIPTIDEAGVRGFFFQYWAGFFVPRGTPKPIIDRINAAVVSALADPEVKRKLEDQCFEIPPPDQQTPQALGAFVRSQTEEWSPIIKAASIKPE
jgi:tripartite-type tricarboxylate transporter receptor subunit TctC